MSSSQFTRMLDKEAEVTAAVASDKPSGNSIGMSLLRTQAKSLQRLSVEQPQQRPSAAAAASKSSEVRSRRSFMNEDIFGREASASFLDQEAKVPFEKLKQVRKISMH